MFVVIGIVFIISFLFLLKLNQKPKGLPPGEWGRPIIGYLPGNRERMPPLLKKMKKQHGDTYIIRLGSRLNVFFCDYDTVKNTYSKTTTASRPVMFSLRKIFTQKNDGIIMSNGHSWNSNRRFALRTLRDFGLGKSSLEDTVLDESQHFVNTLKKSVGEPTIINWSINVATLNVVWRLVAGKRFDIEDEKIVMFSKILTDGFSAREGPMMFLDIYPEIIPFVPQFLKYKWMKVDEIENNRNKLDKFMLDIIHDCEKTFDPTNPRHFIDMYLIEREAQKDDPSLQFRQGDFSDLITTMSDLFFAGSDTTSQTIKWLFLYMAKYPEVQKKAQQEIDSVVPRSRLPLLEDKEKLPYLDALVHDLQRVIALVPMSVPHICEEDLHIDGYVIPKGTILNACIEDIHRNKKYWERPDELYPEHFLDSEGKFKFQKEGFLPFGLGRRLCLGESLAKMELFSFVSSVLQNFVISEYADEPISLDPNPLVNTLNIPQEQNIILTERN